MGRKYKTSVWLCLLSVLTGSAVAQEILLYDHGAVRQNSRAALDHLGLSYTVGTTNTFDTLLSSSPWDLVVVDAPDEIPADPNNGAPIYGSLEWDAMKAYVDSGGKAIMSFWEASDGVSSVYEGLELPESFGVNQSLSENYSNISGHQDVYFWEASHPVFDGIAGPLTASSDFNPAPSLATLGTFLNMQAAPGFTATALAGFSSNPAQIFQTAIILQEGSFGPQTIYNGFLFDEFTSQAGRDLIANQIDFLLIPEPSTIGLLGFGLLLVCVCVRRTQA